MKRWMMVSVVAGALALLASAALAQPGRGPGAGPGGPDGPEMMAHAGPHGPGMGFGGHGPGMGRCGPMGRGFGRGHALGPRLMRELGLSDAQRQKLADIRERGAKKTIQAHADLQIAEMDLRKLMHSDKPDLRAIEMQIDRIAGMRAGIEKGRVGAHLEMRSVLTAEQQKKLRELREQGPPPGRRGPGGPMGEDDGEEEEDGDI